MSTVWGWLKSFGGFWYDFVVGDDWTIAAGVCLALGATYGLLRAPGVPSWWLMPVACVAIVAVAVRRANEREAEAAEETVPEPGEGADEPLARDDAAGRDRAGASR